VGGRGGPWDPPVRLGAVGLLKPSSSMETGKSQEGKRHRVFSGGGGTQKGERKRLKSSSSSNEICGLRKKLPRKAQPQERAPKPLGTSPTSWRRGGQHKTQNPAPAPTPASDAEGEAWRRQDLAAGLTAAPRAGQSQEPAALTSTCNVHGGQSPPSYRWMLALRWDAAAAPSTEPGEPTQAPAPAGGTGLPVPGEHQESSGAAEACRRV